MKMENKNAVQTVVYGRFNPVDVRLAAIQMGKNNRLLEKWCASMHRKEGQRCPVRKSENPRLYYALKRARPSLDRNNDHVIQIEELASIKGTLDLSASRINNLWGMQSCTNISVLYINDNKICDLSPLENLRNLKQLYAHHNLIEKIQALPRDLSVLNLGKNKLTDGTALADLKKLTVLFAEHNYIRSAEFLKNLFGLRMLVLSGNRIEDLSPIAGLNWLEHVDVGENNIESIKPLCMLNRLQYLRLSSNRIADISALPRVRFRYLYLERNYINLQKSVPSINRISALCKSLFPQREPVGAG